jgi:hypothetical protein
MHKPNGSVMLGTRAEGRRETTPAWTMDDVHLLESHGHAILI